MKKLLLPLVLVILVIATSCHKDDNTNPTKEPTENSVVGQWQIDSVFNVTLQADGSTTQQDLTELIGDGSFVNFKKSDSVHFYIDVTMVVTIDSTLAYKVVGDSLQLSSTDMTVTVPYTLTESTLNTQFPLADSSYANIFLKR